MKKPVIGVSMAPTATPARPDWQEQSFFGCQGLGRQTNPAIMASHVPPQTITPTQAQAPAPVQAQCGFDCVTLVFQGELEARDSAGHAHVLRAGDALWSSAGHGLLRQDRCGPSLRTQGGLLESLTLWVNLPAPYKQAAPHCLPLAARQIPVASLPDDAGTLRIIAGEWENHIGPAETATPLQLWDMRLRQGASVTLPLPRGWYGILLVLEGRLRVNYWQHAVTSGQLVVLDAAGDQVALQIEQDTHVVLLSGEPLDEPLVASDALVMNHEDQIAQARQALAQGRLGPLAAESPALPAATP